LKKIGNFLNYIIFPILIVLIWFYVTEKKLTSVLILPKIDSVIDAFKDEFESGRIIEDMSISLSRVVKGYSLAAIVGISLGVFMGMSEKINKFFTLTFTSIRQVPMMAWIPLLIMWFGIGEESKIAVIFIASYFPIMINTVSGIRRTDKKLIEVGRMYKLSNWEIFRKVYFPSALPSIFVGLKLGLGISWMAVVGAEMIAASSGIGFRINDARSLMQSQVVFAGIISIAFIGVVMDLLLTFISKKSTPWEYK
jgi:sulfonate transport system permease protein